MQLSDILSHSISSNFQQVDGFLNNKKLPIGHVKNIGIGCICLNFYCKHCREMRSFMHKKKVQCLGVKDNLVSIDCVLKCTSCEETVPVWFLIESEAEMYSVSPKVKISKYSNKLTDNVCYNELTNEYMELIEKADRAYQEELGTGAVIYLRKTYEIIVSQIVKKYNINKQLNFKEKLEEANKKTHFIPFALDDRKYKLFQELSNIIHCDFEEKQALQEYPVLREIIQAIVQNIQTNNRLQLLKKELNF